MAKVDEVKSKLLGLIATADAATGENSGDLTEAFLNLLAPYPSAAEAAKAAAESEANAKASEEIAVESAANAKASENNARESATLAEDALSHMQYVGYLTTVDDGNQNVTIAITGTGVINIVDDGAGNVKLEVI